MDDDQYGNLNEMLHACTTYRPPNPQIYFNTLMDSQILAVTELSRNKQWSCFVHKSDCTLAFPIAMYVTVCHAIGCLCSLLLLFQSNASS